jgi:hypothetical protein
MENIKLTAAHDLPDGTYRAVWSGDTIFIERPEAELKTVLGLRGRREGRVIVTEPDRMSVWFSDNTDDTLDMDPAEAGGEAG